MTDGRIYAECDTRHISATWQPLMAPRLIYAECDTRHTSATWQPLVAPRQAICRASHSAYLGHVAGPGVPWVGYMPSVTLDIKPPRVTIWYL